MGSEKGTTCTVVAERPRIGAPEGLSFGARVRWHLGRHFDQGDPNAGALSPKRSPTGRKGGKGTEGGALVYGVRETDDPQYLKRHALMRPRGSSGGRRTFFRASAGAILTVATLAGLGCANSSRLDSAADLQQSAEASPASTLPSPFPQVALTSPSPTPFVVTTPLAVPHDNDGLGPVRFFLSGNPWKKNDKLRRTVPMDDFFLGSVRDGIPAILEPDFETAAQANEWLDPLEPVILLELDSDVRAYPVQILILHEIVNDVVDGQPVLVSY